MSSTPKMTKSDWDKVDEVVGTKSFFGKCQQFMFLADELSSDAQSLFSSVTTDTNPEDYSDQDWEMIKQNLKNAQIDFNENWDKHTNNLLGKTKSSPYVQGGKRDLFWETLQVEYTKLLKGIERTNEFYEKNGDKYRTRSNTIRDAHVEFAEKIKRMLEENGVQMGYV